MNHLLKEAHPLLLVHNIGIQPAKLLAKQQTLRQLIPEVGIIIPFSAIGIASEHLNIARVDSRERGYVIANMPDPCQEAVEGLHIRLRVVLGKIKLIVRLPGIDPLHHHVVVIRPVAAAAGAMGMLGVPAALRRHRSDLVKIDAVHRKGCLDSPCHRIHQLMPPGKGGTNRRETGVLPTYLLLGIGDKIGFAVL